MEKCFDIGEIQAFLDGELPFGLSEKVACHIADCNRCAAVLAEAEEETAFAFAALEQELNTLVPTHRLWRKINDSIEQNKSKTIWESVFANFKLLFANPSIAAFAGLIIVAGIIAVVWNSGFNENGNNIAQNIEPQQKIILPKKSIEIPILPAENVLVKRVDTTKNLSPEKESNSYRIVKADFVKSSETKKSVFQPIRQGNNFDSRQPVISAAAEYLPGEDTYIKTIAALEKTVDSRKDEVLKPSARFSFEKDLAVADDAIAKMKSEVKKNPKNEAAKQILIASYQNKIELLNSVAEKNDLMASLR